MGEIIRIFPPAGQICERADSHVRGEEKYQQQIAESRSQDRDNTTRRNLHYCSIQMNCFLEPAQRAFSGVSAMGQVIRNNSRYSR